MLDEPRLSDVTVGSAEWFTIQRNLIEECSLIPDAFRMVRQDAKRRAVRICNERADIGTRERIEFRETVRFHRHHIRCRPWHIRPRRRCTEAAVLRQSLRAILLTHVFHHLPSPDKFSQEASRTLAPGGVISMVDIAHTPFALLFSNFHPEGHHDSRSSWVLDETEPLGGANQAMAWIIFKRDLLILKSSTRNCISSCSNTCRGSGISALAALRGAIWFRFLWYRLFV